MNLDGVPERTARRLSERPNGCWSYEGSHKDGYPHMHWQGRTENVVRVLWQILRGPIPEGLAVDHVVCEDRSCANPAHCQLLTRPDNAKREVMARRAREGCSRGHGPQAWRVGRDGRRRCSTCIADYNHREKQVS